MRKRKKLQELTIKDSFMFGAVMIDEENCKDFLELTLEFPIEKVTVSKEKSIIYHPEYKGVRLDVIAKDKDHTHYDVEMQVAMQPALGKRTRYYHSQIDMEMLETGLAYEELADAYVIFICDYDPFGAGLYRYSWDMTCREAEDIELYDGSHTIILSTCGENDDEVPEELVKFLKFVGAGLEESTEDYEDDYVRRLQDSVKHIKTSREMEARYMLVREYFRDELEEEIEDIKAEITEKARAAGLAAGRAEGLAEGERIRNIEVIIEVLSDITENIPDELLQRIKSETDSDVLKEYFRKARKVSSIEEFEEWINKK